MTLLAVRTAIVTGAGRGVGRDIALLSPAMGRALMPLERFGDVFSRDPI